MTVQRTISRETCWRRSAPWHVPAILCLALMFALPARGQQTNAPARLDYSAFKIVNDRNIFNPRRSPRYTPSDRRETRRAVRADSFALVGTMTYEKGPVAFFDGTSQDYRKAIRTDEVIAGFKVTGIAPSFVRLDAGTNRLDLKVGFQLRKEEGSDWNVSERPETPASTYASSRPTVTPAASAAPSNNEGDSQSVLMNALSQILGGDSRPDGASTNAPGPPPGPPGGESDVLRRLMERAAAERGDAQ